jgi:RNA polymerase sigma-70 factor, ECF subfamily
VQPSSDPAADEADLVERVRAGDVDAYDVLVRRYMRRAFAVAYRLLEHREDAEDLVQETFMTVLRQIHTFQPGRPFAPWMYRILVNRGLNARRARSLRRTDAIPDDAAAAAESPHTAVERAEIRERFRASLAELPPRQRMIIQLIEIDGLTRPEVAAALEISEATVRWHIHEAWRVLRRSLGVLHDGDHDGDDESESL